MKLDENQKKQFIVLCGLIVLIFGFGAYRVIGMGNNAVPSPPSQKVRTAKKTVVPTATNQPVDVKVTETAADMTPSNAETGRDPFAPQIVPKAGSNTVAQQSPKPRTIPPAFPAMNLPAIAVRPASVQPMPVQPVANNSVSKPVDSALSEVNALRLTGIINGPMKLAIIRGAEDARYIVREGERIDGKYKVEHILGENVLIRFQNKDFVLRLGGSDSSEKRS